MIKAHHPKTRAERRKLHIQKDIKFEIKETVKEPQDADQHLELDDQSTNHR